MGDVFVLGRDAVGIVAENRDPAYSNGVFRYYLTDCCGASAKGLDGYVGCRSCYVEIDPELGACPDSITRFIDGRIETEAVPMRLVEVYGDGIEWSVWKARAIA